MKRREDTKARVRRIGERDGWMCAICKHAIDRTLSQDEMPRLQRGSARWNLVKNWAPTVDHRIPKRQFGVLPGEKSGLRDDDSNLQITHAQCNGRKGNKTQLFRLESPGGRRVL